MKEKHLVDPKKILKDTQDVFAVFNKFGVPAFLAYGAVLGALRDNDFIPWDDDIDIAVTAPIDFKTRKAIGWALFDLGFKPQPIAFNVFGRLEPSEIGYNGDGETGIIVCEREFKFSIFFFKEEECPIHGKEMVCTPKLGGYKLICSPSKFYEKMDYVKIRGVKFPVPHPVKEYINYTYPGWNKPVKGSHALQYQQLHPEYLNHEQQ